MTTETKAHESHTVAQNAEAARVAIAALGYASLANHASQVALDILRVERDACDPSADPSRAFEALEDLEAACNQLCRRARTLAARNRGCNV